MNDAETLTRAIQKAETNGFTGLTKGWDVDVWRYGGIGNKSEPFIKEPSGVMADYRTIPWQVLVFNHDFARALWGEQGFPGEFTGKYANPLVENNINHGAQKGWQHHIQQVAVAGDPFEYLGQNI